MKRKDNIDVDNNFITKYFGKKISDVQAVKKRLKTSRDANKPVDGVNE